MVKLILMTVLSSFSIFSAELDADKLRKEALEVFKPLRDSLIDSDKNKDLIQLGKKLYQDKRLSINDTISCESCHQLQNFGADGEKTSPGHEGKRGDRNAPTVLNAGVHIAQFWDGRAKDLEEQALGPILNPVEMGMPNEKSVIDKLKKIAEYAPLFKKAFPGEKKSLSFQNIGKAIAAFEKTLLTPSRFDDFLKGKDTLSARELKGLQTFMSIGCTTCHEGEGVGGGMYMKLGFAKDYPHNKDVGRYNVTKNEEDRFVFKVPSLRNILKTGPYFHDGSISTIEEAIKTMGEYQLGEKITKKQVEEIKNFLGSLEGSVKS